jgi:hypothetical protein
MERSFGKDGRVLAAAHADALTRAHRRIGAARQDVADVFKAAGCLADDGDFDDPEDAPDQELAFESRAASARGCAAGSYPTGTGAT